MDIIERIKEKLNTLPEGYDAGDIGDIIGRAIMDDLLESESSNDVVISTIDSFYAGFKHGINFHLHI